MRCSRPNGLWTGVQIVESQPKMGRRSGTSTCTKDENPNRGWGFQWRRRELNPGPQGIEITFIHVRSRWLPPPTGVRGFGHDLASVFLGGRTRDALGHPALVLTPFRYKSYLTVGRLRQFFRLRERLRCRSQLYGPFDEAGREPLTRRLSFSPHVETDRPRRGMGTGKHRDFWRPVKG